MQVEERDVRFMTMALAEARKAMEEDEVPVGAVFVHNDRSISRSSNQCELLTDPTAHAELIGITQACAALGAQRLTEVEVFVTKEPCIMCAGALVMARIARLIIGARDLKAGGCGSVVDLVGHPRMNHRIPTFFGVLEEDCRTLLQQFFLKRR